MNAKNPSNDFQQQDSQGMSETASLLSSVTSLPAAVPSTTGTSTSTQSKYLIPKQKFVKNVLIITYMTCFCIEFARGLFIASTWGTAHHCRGTLKTTHLNAILVSTFSVGRLISSTVLGHLSDIVKDKVILIGSSIASILSMVLYVVAYYHQNAYLLIGSKCLSGIGGGVLSVVRAHTARITTNRQRTTFMALNGAAQYAALGIAPLFAVLITKMSDNMDLDSYYNSFTIPAYILIITNIVNILLLLNVFDDVNVDRKNVNHYSSGSSSSGDDNKSWGVDDDIDPIKQRKFEFLTTLGIVFFIFFNFASRSTFALVEVAATRIYTDKMGLVHHTEKNLASGTLFGYMGFGGLAMFGLTIMLTKYMSEEVLLLVAFLIICLGNLILRITLTSSLLGLIIGLVLIWSIGFPMKQTTVMSSFSKILGGKPQGQMMGYIGTFGSLGRIVMPLFSAMWSDEVSFTFAACISLLSAFLLVFYIYLIRRFKKKYENYHTLE